MHPSLVAVAMCIRMCVLILQGDVRFDENGTRAGLNGVYQLRKLSNWASAWICLYNLAPKGDETPLLSSLISWKLETLEAMDLSLIQRFPYYGGGHNNYTEVPERAVVWRVIKRFV